MAILYINVYIQYINFAKGVVLMNIIISNISKDPIYEQITKQIKDNIIKENVSEGELLPSIRSLAKELKISVITTKRAYEELERDGFIETVPGKGSYVSAKNKEFLKEKKIKSIEDKLMEAIEDSRVIGLTKNELKEMLDILYDNQI
jgi:GntR family transcriptional regulator